MLEEQKERWEERQQEREEQRASAKGGSKKSKSKSKGKSKGNKVKNCPHKLTPEERAERTRSSYIIFAFCGCLMCAIFAGVIALVFVFVV